MSVSWVLQQMHVDVSRGDATAVQSRILHHEFLEFFTVNIMLYDDLKTELIPSLSSWSRHCLPESLRTHWQLRVPQAR